MADFNFPSHNIKKFHRTWLTAQLRDVLETTGRIQEIKLHRKLGLGGQLPGPKACGLRKDSKPAIIVVESVNDSTYKTLRPLYSKTRLVTNLLVFQWKLVDKEASCTLEYSTYNPDAGMLVVQTQIGIFPTQGSDFILIPRKDFVDTEPDSNAMVRLDVSTLRNSLRNLVNISGRGYTASGDADVPADLPQPKPPSTREEFKTAMNNVVQILGLDELYGEEQLTRFAKKAADNTDATLSDLGLQKSDTMALTKVNLFRTIIFCDDSGSMAGNLFRQTLTETVLRLVPLATRLNEKGVSLRFINFPGDWGYDGLNVDDDEARLRAVTPMGGTWIGAALERKVVGPLIRQLDAGEQLSPLLVSIITDGEANDKDEFKATIQRCKQALVGKKLLNKRTLGHSTVIFQIHFIGSDPYARAFIDRLDTNIGSFIFCNKAPLDESIINQGTSPAQRNRMLLDVTATAIDRVLEARSRKLATSPGSRI